MSDSINIKQDIPELFESNLPLIKDLMDRVSRLEEKSLNNEKGNIALKREGNIALSSGIDSQYKLNPNGTIEAISLNSVEKTVNKKLEADDISINNHKLNNKLYELADFKHVLSNDYSDEVKIAGGLTMLGTVLTRAWDNSLKRYVLIRRLVNIPIFSPSMGATEVHPGLQMTPNSEAIKNMQNAYNSYQGDIESYLEKTREQKVEANKKEEDMTENNPSTSTIPPKSMTDLTHQKAI